MDKPYKKLLAGFSVGLIALVLVFGFYQSSNVSGAAGNDEWGSPCPAWHPDACYVGVSGSARMGTEGRNGFFASSQAAPLAVELLCFFAQGRDGAVDIEWQTATELGTNGFELFRSQSENGNYQKISEFIDHCDDSGLVGGYYQFEDRSVIDGGVYYYKLVETASDFQQIEYGPIVAAAGSPTLTFTPSPTPTPSNTPTPSITPTPSRSPTPNEAMTSPPQQPNPTKTNTATASPTMTPTGTRKTPASTATQSGAKDTPIPSTPLPGSTERTQTPVTLTSTMPVSENTEVVETRLTEMFVPVGGASGSPEMTPDVESIDEGSTSGYPMAAPTASVDAGMAGYPLSLPAETALPMAYVPPPTRVVSQLATMTPRPVQIVGKVESDDPSRAWLVIGFFASLAILAGGLYGVARHWRRQAPVTEFCSDETGDDAGIESMDHSIGPE